MRIAHSVCFQTYASHALHSRLGCPYIGSRTHHTHTHARTHTHTHTYTHTHTRTRARVQHYPSCTVHSLPEARTANCNVPYCSFGLAKARSLDDWVTSNFLGKVGSHPIIQGIGVLPSQTAPVLHRAGGGHQVPTHQHAVAGVRTAVRRHDARHGAARLQAQARARPPTQSHSYRRNSLGAGSCARRTGRWWSSYGRPGGARHRATTTRTGGRAGETATTTRNRISGRHLAIKLLT